MATNVGVARIFDWGGKLQITCNDVTGNFERRIFLWGQRYRRMEAQKSWPDVGTKLETRSSIGLKPIFKMQNCLNWEMCVE